ncbi:MAG: SRPBCC family protein [Chloroflexi bacterium]|nr:SRPBCC family protein [Chloroflexota bacterium]MCI0577786.1 SRPBCC family protein [Chloroflexota bacterium]MCI0643408.1 SRPBCC family protein [Chloroflexota bacterium]MCI0731046.1 SRPBCC family protein [Chloroflexota bacterium]
MSQIHVEASAVINARPEKIYGILSDYRVGHPAILPKPYFTELTVEEGGQGAGTVMRVRMKVMGVEVAYHLVVSEPEPGRVLVETDEAAGVVTTFTVEPLNGGQQSRVTIATDMRASPGLRGFMEKLMNPPVTRRIYRQELENLAEYVGRS